MVDVDKIVVMVLLTSCLQSTWVRSNASSGGERTLQAAWRWPGCVIYPVFAVTGCRCVWCPRFAMCGVYRQVLTYCIVALAQTQRLFAELGL